jgi:hypothetical protein
MDKIDLLPKPVITETADAGRVRLGAGFRLPAPVPAEIADTGRIRLGAGFRLPADRTAA